MIASCLQNEIQQGSDWDKPSIHSAHSLHKTLETFIKFSPFKKSSGQMRIHNARATLPGQFVLILLAHHRVKRFELCPI